MAITETSKPIQLSGQSSWQDLKHVSRLILPLRKRIVVHGVVLLFVFVVICVFRPQAPIGPIAFAIIAAIYFVMLYRIQRRSFVEGQAKRVSTQMEVDDSGVLVRTENQEMRFAWSAFETVTRDDRYIVLRGREAGRMPMLCLPLFPLGTVLGARILYLLTTGSEPRLLTPEYEQIVRIAGPMKFQNPSHIRLVLWIAFVLAFFVLMIGLIYLISLIPEDIRHNL